MREGHQPRAAAELGALEDLERIRARYLADVAQEARAARRSMEKVPKGRPPVR